MEKARVKKINNKIQSCLNIFGAAFDCLIGNLAISIRDVIQAVSISRGRFRLSRVIRLDRDVGVRVRGIIDISSKGVRLRKWIE